MDDQRARDLVAGAPVARLATVNPGGGVDVVPITFALDGDHLVTAVDQKPKTTTDLRRLRNVREHPEVTVLVDHYDEDWDRLWWVRLRGRARVVAEGPDRDRAADLLRERYDQYRDRPPQGAAIWVEITSWTGWEPHAG